MPTTKNQTMTRRVSRKKNVASTEARKERAGTSLPRLGTYARKHPARKLTPGHREILRRVPGLRPADLFQRIIDGEIPVHRIFENNEVIAFLDANPLSPGHTLVVPKEAAVTLDELSEPAAAAIGRVLPRLARAILLATGIEDYNILQNNGLMAHQVIRRVHFHIIPKPTPSEGLGIAWPARELEPREAEDLKSRILQKFTVNEG